MPLNPLTRQVARNPLEFFRTTTVNPPAEVVQYRQTQNIALDAQLRFFSDRGAIGRNNIAYTSGQVIPQVVWIEFEQDPVYPGAVKFTVDYAQAQPNAATYTDVSADFEQRVDARDRLPVWYLPWKPNHLAGLTIPRYREENVRDFRGPTDARELFIDPYNPHLFFTAGLTGCSVFAYGDPRSPTIVHAGTNTSTPYGDDSARFWRELLFVERFQRRVHGGIAREINVGDYMGDTPSFQDFNAWLGRQPSTFVVEQVINFGSVFGIRYGAHWSLYLQQNAIVMRYKLEKRTRRTETQTGGILGFFTKTVVSEVQYEVKKDTTITRPISVRPFYPDGGHATFWDTFQRAFGA